MAPARQVAPNPVGATGCVVARPHNTPSTRQPITFDTSVPAGHPPPEKTSPIPTRAALPTTPPNATAAAMVRRGGRLESGTAGSKAAGCTSRTLPAYVAGADAGSLGKARADWLTRGMDLGDLRRNYERAGIDEADANPDPFAQFATWMGEAVDAEVPEPNAMVVATVDEDGYPAARVVLLKSFDTDGLVFYTNYHSAKGDDLAARPRAALLFSWLELHRQVRVVGDVAVCSAAESDAYFARRPRGSQIGAWASAQSEVVAARATLDEAWQGVEERFAGGPVPRPPHWGGYRVVPHRFEFWQGRPNRMHDRITYRRVDNVWERSRLAP